MVSFLSVTEGTAFDFALSARARIHNRLLTLALTWMQRALVHEGAGAKTSAGYGRFRLEGTSHSPAIGRDTSCIHTRDRTRYARLSRRRQPGMRRLRSCGPLRCVGSCAGGGERCTPLIWTETNLRRLETAIWGDAQSGAALALSVRSESRPVPQLFDKNAITKRSRGEARGHSGIHYLAYGMDETKQGHSRAALAPRTRRTVDGHAERSPGTPEFVACRRCRRIATGCGGAVAVVPLRRRWLQVTPGIRFLQRPRYKGNRQCKRLHGYRSELASRGRDRRSSWSSREVIQPRRHAAAVGGCNAVA